MKKKPPSTKPRCPWALTDPLYIEYHDLEWGQPLLDSNQLFTMLILEGMQAGLSWLTVLKKRANYHRAFCNFEAAKIARFSPAKIEKLLQNPGIIRNRLKVNAIVNNAKAYLKLTEQQPFSDYCWQFVDGRPIQNAWQQMNQVPNKTALSDKLAKDLKQRGFKFVGSTIVYAFMQAVGLVNDHLTSCCCYKISQQAAKKLRGK